MEATRKAMTVVFMMLLYRSVLEVSALYTCILFYSILFLFLSPILNLILIQFNSSSSHYAHAYVFFVVLLLSYSILFCSLLFYCNAILS